MVDPIQNTNQALLHNTAVEKVQQAQQGSPEIQHHLFSKQLQVQEELKRNKVSDTKKTEDKTINDQKRESQKELAGKRNRMSWSKDEAKKRVDQELSKDEENETLESGRIIDIRV